MNLKIWLHGEPCIGLINEDTPFSSTVFWFTVDVCQSSVNIDLLICALVQ